MTFEVEVDGQVRPVSVERAGPSGQYQVTIDGRTHAVNARRVGEHGLVLVPGTFARKVPATSADKPPDNANLAQPSTAGRYDKVPATFGPYDKVPATFQGMAPGVFRAKVPGTGHAAHQVELFVTPAGTGGEVLVQLEGRTARVRVNGRRVGHAADTAGHADGEQRVVAPMPGRVVRVLVAAGDEVAAKQALVVVEAMKMENELRASRKGRVKDVSVSPGTSVEAGRVLMVIE